VGAWAGALVGAVVDVGGGSVVLALQAASSMLAMTSRAMRLAIFFMSVLLGLLLAEIQRCEMGRINSGKYRRNDVKMQE
jgi:hypothetical protein